MTANSDQILFWENYDQLNDYDLLTNMPYVVLDPDTDEEEEFARTLQHNRWWGDVGAGLSKKGDDGGGADDYS